MPVRMDERTRQQLTELFDQMEGDVTLHVFTSEECAYCEEAEQIADILDGLSDKLRVEKWRHEESPAKAEELGVDKYPAMVIQGRKPARCRYYGLPVGYEFSVLVDTILDAAGGEPSVSEETLKIISGVSQPVHIQVFVSPTCPYSPISARTAFKFALLNRNISSDVIEATEFPELVQKYQIRAVPKIIINEVVQFEGAGPEEDFAKKVLEAVKLSER